MTNAIGGRQIREDVIATADLEQAEEFRQVCVIIRAS